MFGETRVALHNPRRFEQWLPACFDGLFHWDFLLPAFKETKIKPMDIDCCIERNNHFLMFETKLPGVSVETGQQITLTNLWRNGKTTIIHVEGKTAKTITKFSIYAEWEEQKDEQFGSRQLTPANAFDLIYVERRWFCRVHHIETPDREKWDAELWLWDYQAER